MNVDPLCPICGNPVTADAPQGLCPECLTKSGSESDTTGESMGDSRPAHESLVPKNYNLSIGSCLRRGWALVFGDFWAFTGVTLLILVLRTIALSTFFGALISGPLMGGLLLYFLKKIRGEQTSIRTAFSGLSTAFLPLFLGSVISSLLLFIGFFCLLLPGIYLMVAWSFTLVLIIDKQVGFWTAMGLSRQTISKHWWKFFGLFIVLALLNMIGTLVFFIGTLITVPVSLATLMFAYEDIFGSPMHRADRIEGSPRRSKHLLAWSLAALFVLLVTIGLAFHGRRQASPKKIHIVDVIESTNIDVVDVTQATNPIPTEEPTPSPSPVASQIIDSTPSKSFDGLLNADQKLALRYINLKFQKFDEQRTLDNWPSAERAHLEKRMIETLNGARTDAYYQAINTLAVLHSTNSLPLLRKIAFEHQDKISRVEISNRPRWMAVRAMGFIGDKTVVPDMIHLLYHNNSYVRWSAQIALVRLTGQNFGKDWLAWGDWWTQQKSNPPFSSKIVYWWRGQAAPDELEKELTDNDQKFLESFRGKMAKKGLLIP